MRILKQPWVPLLLLIVMAGIAWTIYSTPENRRTRPIEPVFEKPVREHTDHRALIKGPLRTGSDVTRECLRCHPDAAREVMATAHWTWLGEPVRVHGRDGKMRIGKRNLINNFCLGIQGNWPSCTKCHAGYGWVDDHFDFKDRTAVDCLVCHDWTGTYVKEEGGHPDSSVDLLAVARGVGYSKRSNCGYCHSFGGGGMGVKHGDLDISLNMPTELDDVHMGRAGFLCTDCHRTEDHDIPGRSMSVSINRRNGVFCEDCHQEAPHADARLNAHLNAVACESCHIPTYARRNPTKLEWNWSTAGDDTRPDDPHHYLKIKGDFVYGTDLIPVYRWWNGHSHRYLLGDRINPRKVTRINDPHGDIRDPRAKIHPFKVHLGRQPYDAGTNQLAVPLTAGEGGYWDTFDWESAMARGAAFTGLQWSGKMGFAPTEMYWPLSHMVMPEEHALSCGDCHGTDGRMDWAALGYAGDPIVSGGRK